MFDEVDALCGIRKSRSNDGAQRMTSELLSCLSKYTKVMVIGTANLPWTIDVAFIRRFQHHIFVSLPSDIEQCTLIQILLAKYPHTLEEKYVSKVADETKEFTGDAVERCVDSVADRMAERH